SDIYLCFFLLGTPRTEIYTLSLHDALPIFRAGGDGQLPGRPRPQRALRLRHDVRRAQRHLPPRRREVDPGPRERAQRRHLLPARSEEHTSELQSRENLVCRLLLEKKKTKPK